MVMLMLAVEGCSFTAPCDSLSFTPVLCSYGEGGFLMHGSA